MVYALRFGNTIKGLGLVCLLLFFIPMFVLITGNYQIDKPGETTALIALIIGFGIASFYTLAEAFLVRGSYDSFSIKFSTPWTESKDERWEDLISVTYNGWCSWYLLQFNNGKVIRVSSYLSGSAGLIQLLQKHGYKF